MCQQTTDRGLVKDSDDPFFYLYVFGGTIAMNQADMHECVEEMVYTRKKRAAANPRQLATAKQLKEKVADFVEAVGDARIGRKRFATGGT